jgi:hypothetical protein
MHAHTEAVPQTYLEEWFRQLLLRLSLLLSLPSLLWMSATTDAAPAAAPVGSVHALLGLEIVGQARAGALCHYISEVAVHTPVEFAPCDANVVQQTCAVSVWAQFDSGEEKRGIQPYLQIVTMVRSH